MTDFDAIKTLLDTGLSILFLWLYLQKDKETKQLWADRLADSKNWIDTLTAVIIHQDKPTPSSLVKAQRLMDAELGQREK